MGDSGVSAILCGGCLFTIVLFGLAALLARRSGRRQAAELASVAASIGFTIADGAGWRGAIGQRPARIAHGAGRRQLSGGGGGTAVYVVEVALQRPAIGGECVTRGYDAQAPTFAQVFRTGATVSLPPDHQSALTELVHSGMTYVELLDRRPSSPGALGPVHLVVWVPRVPAGALGEALARIDQAAARLERL